MPGHLKADPPRTSFEPGITVSHRYQTIAPLKPTTMEFVVQRTFPRFKSVHVEVVLGLGGLKASKKRELVLKGKVG